MKWNDMDTNDGTQMPIRNDTFINKSQHTRNMFFFLYLLRIECLDNVFLITKYLCIRRFG